MRIAPPASSPPPPAMTAVNHDAEQVIRARANIQRRRRLMATRVGTTTLGKALDGSVRIRFEGTGTFSSRRLVGETPFARFLLRDPKSGPALVRFLRATLAHLDGEELTARLSGISFSVDELGAAVNRFLTTMSISDFPRMVPSATDAELLRTFRQSRAATGPSTAATYFHTRDGGWIDLGSIASTLPFAVLGTDLLRGTKAKRADADMAKAMTQLLYMLHHELEHARTPDGRPTLSLRRYIAEGTGLNWLEEGTADVLSTWGTNLAAFGASLGVSEQVRAQMPAHPSPAYPHRTRVVRALLVAAGLDLDVAADAATARELLQGRPLAQVPRAIADAITAARGLRPEGVELLARRIAALEGRPARLAALQQAYGLPVRPGPPQGERPAAAEAARTSSSLAAPAAGVRAGTTRPGRANTL